MYCTVEYLCIRSHSFDSWLATERRPNHACPSSGLCYLQPLFAWKHGVKPRDATNGIQPPFLPLFSQKIIPRNRTVRLPSTLVARGKSTCSLLRSKVSRKQATYNFVKLEDATMFGVSGGERT